MRVRRRSLRGPELDVPWRDVEYVVVDVETTGLDLRRDVVISFGSVLVRSGRLCWGTRTYLADPAGACDQRERDARARPAADRTSTPRR